MISCWCRQSSKVLWILFTWLTRLRCSIYVFRVMMRLKKLNRFRIGSGSSCWLTKQMLKTASTEWLTPPKWEWYCNQSALWKCSGMEMFLMLQFAPCIIWGLNLRLNRGRSLSTEIVFTLSMEGLISHPDINSISPITEPSSSNPKIVQQTVVNRGERVDSQMYKSAPHLSEVAACL